MERRRLWNCAQRHTLTLKCVNFVNFVNFWKEHPTALAMGLASLINIYVCEIVYLFQDQTFYLAAIAGEEAIGITCDYSSNAVSNPS